MYSGTVERHCGCGRARSVIAESRSWGERGGDVTPARPLSRRPGRLIMSWPIQRRARMKVKRIEHVGIVVRDVEASRKLWEGCFGIPLAGTEDNATRRLALYPVGDSMVELIAGLTPDSKQAKLIAAGKGGLNHVCLEVENIDEALAELKAKGIPLLDEVPRIGHAGCRIAFLDPAATENCLIELAELPAGSAGH
ncbi:MAG: VOC family protein [Betaproteobacteria bacterium]|nr:VOC family protein [Betaproteobacteria bacterium]